MGRNCKGGIRMEMLAGQSMHNTGKESRAAGVRSNSLWRVLTLDM